MRAGRCRLIGEPIALMSWPRIDVAHASMMCAQAHRRGFELLIPLWCWTPAIGVGFALILRQISAGVLERTAANKGENNEYWHHSADCPDPDSGRCAAHLAACPQLGLWPQWNRR